MCVGVCKGRLIRNPSEKVQDCNNLGSLRKFVKVSHFKRNNSGKSVGLEHVIISPLTDELELV